MRLSDHSTRMLLGSRATQSPLAHLVEAAKLPDEHLLSIMTYFSDNIPKAIAKEVNPKPAIVQKRSCGDWNPEHFKIAAHVSVHCGSLNHWWHRWPC